MAHDEEALSWLGDEDANLKPGWKTVGSKHPHDVEATTEADTVLDLDEDDEDDELVGPSSTSLVALGVLAGVYFLYTLGWLTYATRSASSSGSDVLADTMWNIGLWLAVLAPPLWFVLTFWLVKRSALRYSVLLLGALILIPIPLVWP